MKPESHDDCLTFLKQQYIELGIDAHVTVCPEVIAVGPYAPTVSRCPHGELFLAEPTGEQIAEWVRTGAP